MFWTRRRFLQAGLIAAGAAVLPRCRSFSGSIAPPLPANLPSTTPWPEANAILAGVVPPRFPDARFVVTDYGARGDGRSDDTDAFLGAIAACSRAGGGHVVVPAGDWSVGALRLASGVDLNLAAGATLRFSGDARLYPPVLTRYEGIECINHSPMIYAYGEHDVAVTGAGTLDASAVGAWNQGSDRAGVLEPLVDLPPEQRVVTGKLRVAFVEPYLCTDVLLQGVTLIGTAFWQLHPTLCTNVTVDGVTTRASDVGTDGCDLESCDHVVVKNCSLGSGDDNLALKSGRDADGRRLNVPTQNVVILNCQAEGPYAFLACGSELTGGIRNIYGYNLWTYGQGVGAALRIKTNTQRGGFVTGVHLDGFDGHDFLDDVVDIDFSYGGQTGPYPPRVDDLHLSHFKIAQAPMPLNLRGLSSDQIGTLTISDSQLDGIASASSTLENAPRVVFSNVTINGRSAG